MKWPFAFGRRETRQDSNFTHLLTSYAIDQAGGDGPVTAAMTGALETASGIVGRAFAGAEVEGPAEFTDALDPDCLGLIGRALIRSGQALFLIAVEGGAVRLFPSAEWDVLSGGHDPASWRYRLTLNGPNEYSTVTVPGARVLHVRYAIDPEYPWRGVGPLQSAILTGRLSARTLNALADESGSMMGFLLPTPKGGDDSTLAQLRGDLKDSRGRTHMVESMSAGWDQQLPQRASQDWMRRRLGPEPPDAMVKLQETATREVLSACGISPALLDARAAAAAREAWRAFLFGSLMPLARKLQHEVRRKLDPAIGFTWDEIRSSDLAGRARAFQSMVGAGMDPAKAANLAGLMEPESD